MTAFHIPFASSQVIFTEGEFAYQRVLDDFSNAERISVVTFNISTEKSDLLDEVAPRNWTVG